MKTIASRTLAASPGQVWAALKREGALGVREIRTRAAETGDADLTQADIEREIEAARQACGEREPT